MTTATKISDIELALFQAIRLFEHMDASTYQERPIDAPEIIYWALTKLQPELCARLYASRQDNEVIQLLMYYRSLRNRSDELFMSRGADYCPMGYPSLNLYEIAGTLETGAWTCHDKLAYRTLTTVILPNFQKIAEEVESKHRRWDIDSHSACVHRLPSKPMPFEHSLERKDSLVPEGLSALVTQALAQAEQCLIACDDGSGRQFWRHNYASVAFDWIAIEQPKLAQLILTSNSSIELNSAYKALVEHMRTVECLWERLSQPIRTLLLQNPEQESINVLLTVLKENTRFSVADQEVFARHVWLMVKRRAAPPETPTSRLKFTERSSPMLDEIWRDSRNTSACFVVDTEKLPPDLSAKISEKFSLVVKLGQAWMQQRDMLEEQNYVFQAWFGDGEEERCVLAISKAFSCRYAEIWPHMQRFRRQIPVIYLFEHKRGLVSYDFAHFTELPEIARHGRDVHEYLRLPDDGEAPVPVVASELVDMSSQGRPTPFTIAVWEDIVERLREDPDADWDTENKEKKAFWTWKNGL
ncbi:hypothetical protein [Caballeronia sp. J97]|uniref:hypothetical protein n=1 Tax=Caballeronia sp. J97 TaxID=2805429 RepID=UPI002AAF437B|nr:hypothetical protein [Caballeronia sp. J97]